MYLGNSRLRSAVLLALAGGTLFQIGSCIPALAAPIFSVAEQILGTRLLGGLPIF